MESILNNLTKEKTPGPDGFTAGFYQTFKDKMLSTLHNIFQKIEASKTFPTSFFKANITLLPLNTIITR